MDEDHISKALTDDEVAVLRELMMAVAKRDKNAIANHKRVTLQPDEFFWETVGWQNFGYHEPDDDFLRTAFGGVFDDGSGLFIDVELFITDGDMGVFVEFEISRNETPSSFEFIKASW